MKKNNGVCAVIRGQSDKPCVGIRADMDALPINEDVEWAHKSKSPNIMHACGHDIHTVSYTHLDVYKRQVLNTIKV